MKYKIVLVWKEVGTVSVDANSLEEAKEKALDIVPLPDGEYVFGSLVVDHDGTYHENIELAVEERLAQIVDQLGKDKSNTKMAVWWQGFLDGYKSPDELSSGVSYPTKELNEAYDDGANNGQIVGAKMKVTKPQEE